METVAGHHAREGERGAASIKTVLIFLFLAALTFGVVKIVPVYVEQRQVVYEVEEVARIASVRNFKEERIAQEIEKIRESNDLPDGSINLVTSGNSVRINLSYSRTINLLVTNYVWRVEKDITGKSL
jgi:Flp pilus assembly protein TadG